MPDVHIEGGGKLQYSYSFLRQNGRYTTPETPLSCCYGPPRDFPATIEYATVYERSGRWGRGARARSIWVRPWLHPERRRQFRIYDQLMLELRREEKIQPRNLKKFHYGQSLKFKVGIFFANVQTIPSTFYCYQTLNLFAQCKLCESMNAKVTSNLGDFFSNRNLLFS